MDIEKLIEQLNRYFEGETLPRGTALDAATALSTLQAENENLRAEADGMRSNWYKAVEEVKKLRDELDEKEKYYDQMIDALAATDNAELERVKMERDAAVESIPHECKTCVYHTVFFNGCTPDHDCTNPDGGCSNNYDRWRWRGPQKEDERSRGRIKAKLN